MDKPCQICNKVAKYKCPKCFIYYCSVTCCKRHKQGVCDDKNTNSIHQDAPTCEKNRKEIGNSSITHDKLELLEKDEKLKNLLANRHLREMINIIDKARNAEGIMQEAMQEPIFVEFANACLKIVDPINNEEG